MIRLLPILVAALLTGCYRLPIWKGHVEVKAMERAAIKKCGSGEPTAEGSKILSRMPYLQSTTTTSTVIAWGATTGRGEVVLSEPGKEEPLSTTRGEYAGDPDRRAARLAARPADVAKMDADDIYLLAARLDGLTPSHLYCYRIVDGGIPLTELAPLNTAAKPGAEEPVHFVALGDSGTGGAAQKAIAKQISATAFDFMVFLGDIAYTRGTATQLQERFFAVYQDFLRFVPVYPAIGNHERYTREGKPYLEAFVLPRPERYYSFDWGDIHFVAIDTTQRDSAQLAWLDKDLSANKLPWTIVFGHHPMYTNSLRGAQVWIRRAFARIVTAHEVDLVVTGHEHQYERFRIGGVNYVISGGGGGQLTRFFGTSAALHQATVHHFLWFEVTPTKLVMKAIDIGGKEIETLQLTKKGDETKVKVDGKSNEPPTPVAPEQKVVPDERVHDEPDDDTRREKIGPGPARDPSPVPLPGPPPKK